MRLSEFKTLCEREWNNGFGDVKELHLDESGYREIVDDLGPVAGSGYPKISSLLNEVTGTYVKIVRHENHAVVERPPHPPPTTHTVKI